MDSTNRIEFYDISADFLYCRCLHRDNNIRYSLLEYSFAMMFFPYAISGPIVRHNFLIPQFREEDRKNLMKRTSQRRIYGFAVGLAKKSFASRYTCESS